MRRARLSGLVRGCGSISVTAAGLGLSLTTENEELAKKISALVYRLYKTDTVLEVEKNNLHTSIIEITVPYSTAKQVLIDTFVINEQGNMIADFTSNDSFSDINFVAQFAAGVFLACGSVYLPEEGKGGYHLEFVFSSENSAENFSHILAEMNFMPKKVARKNSFVVYLKESDAISDFFARIGAGSVVCKLQDIKATREVSNLANRQSNCITANISKTVEAAIAQRQAIETIDSLIGIDNLSTTLAEAARLRLAFPNDTLEELAERTENVTKSALNHRFRKIISLANELGGK